MWSKCCLACSTDLGNGRFRFSARSRKVGTRSNNTRRKMSYGNKRNRFDNAGCDTSTCGAQRNFSRASMRVSSHTDGTCRQSSVSTTATITGKDKMRSRNPRLRKYANWPITAGRTSSSIRSAMTSLSGLGALCRRTWSGFLGFDLLFMPLTIAQVHAVVQADRVELVMFRGT
jgi:hypothetical protein